MEKRHPITVKLPPDLLDEVNQLRAKMPVTPTFTACMEAALREWADRQKKRGSK
jgi:predicted transcriptional regulator